MVCVLLDGGSMNESGAHNPVVCGAFCVFVSILLLYFIYTLVMSKVVDCQPVHIAVGCDTCLGFVSIKLC